MSADATASDPVAPPYRVATSSMTRNDLRELSHPLNPEHIRHTIPLGDICGLTKQGVHLSRVDSHTTSTVLHWHSIDDEWVYILDAGDDGATLLVHIEGEAEPREEKISKGDFLGFPAGRPIAHALRAGDHELVYLVGGTRAPMDVCTYPSKGKRLVVDNTRSDGGRKWVGWFADEDHITSA